MQRNTSCKYRECNENFFTIVSTHELSIQLELNKIVEICQTNIAQVA